LKLGEHEGGLLWPTGVQGAQPPVDQEAKPPPPEADGILVGLLEDTFLRCPGA